ncbi:hypothetical protein IV38_GL000964 [Lactobacillus selangorensis]|uniref:Uncharacterized protein n=1 Tax=Lactobacillus selangorensis TaxID=81857 RepID=A0A0R2FWV5_9LACO|nr:hypothetical protein [Lactobacillus selangorensis]KRN28759.1 hypothetical protein IV38_GL000964 [Lactobacillus selangorensis]KRN32831.1 hypothetical protein IV40_GL000889 [Lactobacillus selangorensis]
MYTWTFWILAVWFVVNVIWMFAQSKNQSLLKTFAWINVIAIIWGFWAYYAAASHGAIGGWFITLNWINVVLAIYQFYVGYSKD